MKRCRVCRERFIPSRPLQCVCSMRCALLLAEKARTKADAAQKAAERKRDRVRRDAMKRRSDYVREAQQAFNRYIRLRDDAEPCISCGRYHKGQWHAGHYMSVGARPELRFDERNCHKQCQPCNTHLHGNIVLYRKALIAKYGVAEVERLEGPHEPKKYSVADLVAMKAEFTRRARALCSK